MPRWYIKVAMFCLVLGQSFIFRIPAVIRHIPGEAEFVEAINVILSKFTPLDIEAHIVHKGAQPKDN